MAHNVSSPQYLTLADFNLTNSTQAAAFWKAAYVAHQIINLDPKIIAALTKTFGEHRNPLSYAVTNTTVTDFIRSLLPVQFEQSSHTWICSELQSRTLGESVLDAVVNASRNELCHAIPLDKPLTAAGRPNIVFSYGLILSCCTTAVTLYLVHAARKGPRDMFPNAPEAFNSPGRDPSQATHLLSKKVQDIETTEQPVGQRTIAYAWLFTLIFLNTFIFLWAVVNSKGTQIYYNWAALMLLWRLLFTMNGCLLPFLYKYLDMPLSGSGTLGTTVSIFHMIGIMVNVVFMLAAPTDIEFHEKLFYRDSPCTKKYFLPSLNQTRLIIAIQLLILTVMGSLWLVCELLIDDKLKKLSTKWNSSTTRRYARRFGSLVHPTKFWVILDLLNVAASGYSIWSIRRAVSADGVYAPFVETSFDGTSLVSLGLYIVSAVFVYLLVLDARRKYRMIHNDKTLPNVDGDRKSWEFEMQTSEETEETSKKHSS